MKRSLAGMRFRLPSAAQVMVASLSTLISASSSSSRVCPDSLRRRLRRCHALTPVVNSYYYRTRRQKAHVNWLN